MGVLTNLTVATVSQYIHMSNHHLGYLQPTQYYVTSQLNGGGEIEQHQLALSYSSLQVCGQVISLHEFYKPNGM